MRKGMGVMNRSTRVRGIVRKRQITVGLSVIAMAVALVAVAALAKPPAADGPDKVWVCHFPGHEAGAEWPGPSSTTLDGDYVVAYAEGMPLPTQVNYCEEGVGVASPGGGNLILVSVNSLDGHRAQLQDRLDPDPVTATDPYP